MMLRAPKDVGPNAIFRKALLEKARGSVDLQQEIWVRCARDIVFWLDTFGFTYAPKNHPDCPTRPFILWPYQEQALLKMAAAIGRHPILVEKSRDMGATWLILSLFLWRWQFKSGQSFLVGSRKQELVDKTGDPKTLFWKLDYLLDRQPRWLRPSYSRNLLALHNDENESNIDGESTNDDFARGDRRQAILLDEFPAVDNGYQILKAAGDASLCPIFAGTSQGASGAYYDILTKMRTANPERIIRFFWSEHPDKSKGLYTSDGGRLKLLDESYEFPDGYRHILDGKLRSPAYDEREKQAANAQEMAQEWDIDYMLAGWQFFDSRVIERLKTENVRLPSAEGEILPNPDWRHPEWFARRGGQLNCWFSPVLDGKVNESWNDVVIGVDIAVGNGGAYGSNSVASVVRRTTGEKVAELVANNLNPTEFAESVLSLAVWFHNAFIVYEANGPGAQFGRVIKDSNYRNVYYRNDNETAFATKKTRQPGWWTTKENKRILLSDYARALSEKKFFNPSAEAVAELSEYVHQPNGVIEHTRARSTPDPTASGENHGDRVLADALAWQGMVDRWRPEEKRPESLAPPNTFGFRANMRKQAQKILRPWG